jgi:hypothetical protein
MRSAPRSSLRVVGGLAALAALADRADIAEDLLEDAAVAAQGRGLVARRLDVGGEL